MLYQRRDLTLKECLFWDNSDKFFCSYVTMLGKLLSLFLLRNDNCISTSKQRHFVSVK